MRLASLSAALLTALAIPAPSVAGPPAHHGYYRAVSKPHAFAAATPPKVITYGGATSQDSPLVVQLSRSAKSVSRVGVHWDAPCSSGMSVVFGDTLVASAGPPAATPPDGTHVFTPSAVSGGRFTGNAAGALDFGAYQGVVSQKMTGKLGAKRGTGTYQAHVDVIERATGSKVDDCDTGPLTWKASGPQDLVYGGASSVGEPVVVILDKGRKSVREIRFGWSADCTPAGFVSLGDDLVNFPLSRSGGWGDVFTLTFPLDDGGTNAFAYNIRGKVGRSKVTGSFQVTRTRRDAGGGTVASCPSNTIRFSARQ